MVSLQTSIDRACDLCDGQNKLAQRLGISKGYMSEIRHGKKPMTTAIALQLEKMLGMRAGRLVLQVVNEQARRQKDETAA